MPQTRTPSGTLVEHPDGITVTPDDAAVERRRAAPGSADPVRSGLLDALSRQGMRVQDGFTLAPVQAAARRGPAARVEVPLAPEEAALLLTERDGVYAWVAPPPPREAARRGAPGAAAVFVLGDAPAPGVPARRGPLTDLLAGEAVEPLRAWVVKVAAGWLVGAAKRRLDERVSPGLVGLTDDDPATWHRWPVEALRGAVPGDRSPRLLLLLHGSFSSTVGSFGALAATRSGRAFLRDARGRYDLVLGYDHPTLGLDPDENARALHREVHAAGFGAPPEIDVVAYSRGGLVARGLMEILAGAEGDPRGARLRRAVFVASPMAGTPLAEPEAWRGLLDLHTNLVAAAGRSLALFGLPATATVVAEAAKTLGALAQAVLVAGVEPEQVPGLAAMRPGSPALLRFAATTPPHCFAIASDFEPSRAGGGSLPDRLLRVLADRGADGVIGGANDLVVPAASAAFGAGRGELAGALRWARNGTIHHTAFFVQPGVVAALSNWLLDASGALPAGFEPPAVTLDADRPLDDLTHTDPLGAAIPSAALALRRRHGATPLFYVRRAGELRAALRAIKGPRDRTIAEALDLRESDAAVLADRVAPDEIGPTGAVLLGPGGEVRGVATAPWAEAELAETGEASPTPPLFGRRRVRGHAGASAPGTPGIRGDADTAPASARRSAPADVSAGAGSDGAGWPPRAEAEIACNFAAQMPERPPLASPARLEVAVALESMDAALGPTVARSSAIVSTRLPITLEVRPRANCTVLGCARVDDIRVPAPGRPDTYEFEVRGNAAGPAELWVDVRQGPLRLTRMVLQPDFVDTDRTLSTAAAASTHTPDPPMVELRIFELPGSGDLLFTLQSRELDLQETHVRSGFGSKKDYVAGLYNRLEGSWGRSRLGFDDFMAELRGFGTALYREAIPKEIQQAIWYNRGRIGSIEVISHEPFIPWEVAHLVDPDDEEPVESLPFLAELGLIRWISNEGQAPTRLRLRPDMARYVIPNYPDARWRLPGAEDEIRLLERDLGALRVPPHAQDVRGLLERRGSFDLLHFACHGKAEADRIWDAALMLEGRIDGTAYEEESINAQVVNSYARLRHPDGSRPWVFLNACQAGKSGPGLAGTGGMAQAFLQRGAGLFVGTQWSVGDRTALTFAAAFYDRLRAGDTLAQAVREARRAAKEQMEPTWLAYTVYGHPYARLAPS